MPDGGVELRPALVLDLDLPGLWFGGAPIVGPVRLRIAAGETVALTGPSGIGKTSLLRAIAGLARRKRRPTPVLGRLAYVFQEPTLLPWRTLRQNLQIAVGIDETGADRWLAEVGLSGLGDRFPGQVSLGQQRRLALARAFACRPDLLLMDEPFVSLDAPLVREMMALFEGLRARHRTATLLVTHDPREAEALADRILRLGGRPACIEEERQNSGAYFQLSASGVTTSRS